MLVIKNGDLLEATENLICHQCNEDGVTGGGVALQIANKYPNVEQQYKEYCKLFKNSNVEPYGTYQAVKIGDKKYIVNCFTQRNFVTNLTDLEQVFKGLLETCKINNFTIALPFNYGCGIAKGNWKEVSILFEKLSNEYEIDMTIYKLEV